MTKPKRSSKVAKTFKRRGVFKSKLEVKINKELEGLVGKNFKYESEPLLYTIQKNYWPDFIIRLPKFKVIYLEVKGYFPYEDQAKMKGVKKVHPNLDIRMVFDKDNKIPRTKMRYSDWCKKNNFPYCIGAIPKDWFE